MVCYGRKVYNFTYLIEEISTDRGMESLSFCFHFFQYVPSVEDHVLGIVVDTKADVRIHELHLFGI